MSSHVRSLWYPASTLAETTVVFVVIHRFKVWLTLEQTKKRKKCIYGSARATLLLRNSWAEKNVLVSKGKLLHHLQQCVFFVKKKSIWTKKTGTPHRNSGWTKLRYKLTREFRVGVGTYVSSQRHAARNFDSVIWNPPTQVTDISSIPAPWYEQVYKWKWGTGITASFLDKCSSPGAISWERKTCSIVPIELFARFLVTSKLPSFLLCLRSDIPPNLC